MYVFSPASVHVGAFVSFPSPHSCPNAAISVTSDLLSQPGLVQWCDWLPASSQVASLSTVHSSLYACPRASIASVFVALHLVHVYVFSPASVHVGAFVSFPSPHSCPKASITVTSDLPSQPGLVQWCDLLPASSQVASLSTVHSSLYACPRASIASVFVLSHLVHVYVFSPASVHVGALVSFPSPHSCTKASITVTSVLLSQPGLVQWCDLLPASSQVASLSTVHSSL